jgi:hypothetical protein
LQDVGGSWKLAGFYPRLNSIAGHDGQWYLTKARDYKTKGAMYTAWFYYLTAWDLIAPVNFMSTPQLDRIATELNSARPSNLPSESQPLNLFANGKTFPVIDLSAYPVGPDLNVCVGYQPADAANSALAYQDNMAVIKALVQQHPEFREAFAGVIARAVDANGHDYGSVLEMRDIK